MAMKISCGFTAYQTQKCSYIWIWPARHIFISKLQNPEKNGVSTTPLCKDNLDDLENSNRRVIEENGTQSKNAIDLDKTQYLYIQTFFFGI